MRELHEDEAAISLNMIITHDCFESSPEQLKQAIWERVEKELRKRWPEPLTPSSPSS